MIEREAAPPVSVFPAAGGDMGTRIRAHDWSASPLGSPDGWPSALKIAVNLMLNSPTSMYLAWGPDLIFLFNDAYRPILGPRLPYALGMALPALWHDAWDAVRPMAEKAMAGDAVLTVDLPIRMARYGEPEDTWWTFSYAPILDELGRVGGIFCITNETTAHVLRKTALHDSESELQGVFETMGESFVLLDHDFHVRRINEAGLRIDGRTRDEIVGRHVLDAWPEARDMPSWHLYQQVMRDRQPGHLTYRHAAGAQDIWLEVHASPSRDGLVIFYRDVTASKTAEEALRVSELQLREANERLEQRVSEREATLRDAVDFARLALASVGGVGVWTYDPASDRFFCDAAISDLYALDAAQGAAGILRADFLANVVPEDLPRLKATMEDGLKQKGDLELEYRIRHPDGSIRWVLSRGHTYHDEEGQPVRRTGVGIDMSKQRELEEQLRQAQKMEAVGQLTGGVAHDFNNLLTVIRSSIDLLKRPNLSDDRRRRYIEAISDTTTRAAKLTGQLLAFARRQALRPEVFDAAESVRGVGDMIITLTGSRIRIETTIPGHSCYVNADASQFDTALVNIAVNARDAMDGEGTLSIEVGTASRIPSLRAHPAIDGDFVTVAIGDTGSGIPPEDLDRIFEPFFTTKGVGQGTGLGLSQVFGFVKQSGGEVEVESKPGRGTTFRIYLPRVAGLKPAAELQGDLGTVDGHGTCVLVVEDNADVGLFAIQTLEELGYRSVLAADAGAALAELSKDAARFDVVFSDVVMPGMSGIELGGEIRRLYADLPVILTSGYSHVLAQNGAHGFELLNKPYSIEQLSRVLTKAAQWRRLKRMLDA